MPSPLSPFSPSYLCCCRWLRRADLLVGYPSNVSHSSPQGSATRDFTVCLFFPPFFFSFPRSWRNWFAAGCSKRVMQTRLATSDVWPHLEPQDYTSLNNILLYKVLTVKYLWGDARTAAAIVREHPSSLRFDGPVFWKTSAQPALCYSSIALTCPYLIRFLVEVRWGLVTRCLFLLPFLIYILNLVSNSSSYLSPHQPREGFLSFYTSNLALVPLVKLWVPVRCCQRVAEGTEVAFFHPRGG